MSMSLNLIIRNAQPRDHTAVTDMLADALAGGSLARWLDPDPATQPMTVRSHIDSAVRGALAHGVIRIAEENGDVIAATLWSSRTPGQPSNLTSPGPGNALPDDRQRRCQVLDRLLRERRPARAHHTLDLIGVRHDRRGQELGSYLLIGHHALLHTTGIPAYVCAHDEPSRALFLRHRYTALGDPIVLPDTTTLQPMWRPPVTADPLP